jgi:hypothetical protein
MEEGDRDEENDGGAARPDLGQAKRRETGRVEDDLRDGRVD